MTEFVKSASSNLAPGAYTLDSCASLKSDLEKSPSAISAPDMSKVAADAATILHSRRSYRLSRAAFAWPIADDANWQRPFFDWSIDGNLNCFVCGRGFRGAQGAGGNR